MGQFFDRYIKHNIIFIILTFVCLLFLGAGFLFPPPGEIHNSILLAVGEVIAIMALWAIIIAIDKGADAKLTKGDMTLEINTPEKKEE